MEMRAFHLLTIVIVGFAPFVSSQTKLNVARILLPVATDRTTNFTLEVSDGCYRWSSSRPEIAVVEPIYENDEHIGLCSTKALVSALWSGPSRATSIVWADDSVVRLRCDVIVDRIHAVEIITTTRELFLEDAPEALEVQAKNDLHDTFSSLEGVEFEWKLITDDFLRGTGPSLDAHEVLRFVKFDDSRYETPPAIEPLERHGKQGYMALVEGIQTGSANVSVKPRHSSLASVEPHIVRFVVVANLQLIPSADIYLPVHGIATYKVEQVKHGRSFPVKLPSTQYYLELSDDGVCKLDPSQSSLYCAQLGSASLTLLDRNIQVHHDSFTPPTATIHVVPAAYITLSITPGRAPVLQLGGEYLLEVQIMDPDSHQLYPSKNIVSEIDFDASFLKQLGRESSTAVLVKAIQVGRVVVHGRFLAMRRTDRDDAPIEPVLVRQTEIEIFNPMAVQPQLLLFPFDPLQKAEYSAALKVLGGSGDFSFMSANQDVARVSKLDVGVVSAGWQLGNTTIRASDLKNMAHTATATVHIVPLHRLAFSESHVEQEVGSVLELPIQAFGLLDGEERLFTDCSQLLLQVSFSEKFIFQEINDGGTHTIDKLTSLESPRSCSSISLRAVGVGSTMVTLQHLDNQRRAISDSLTIAAYPPLKLQYPIPAPILAIGSSVPVLFEGGPLPWVLHPDKFYRSAEPIVGDKPTKRQLTRQVEVAAGGGDRHRTHVFRVYCLSLGEQQLTLSVGNKPSSSNRRPRQAHLPLTVRCEEPVALTLRPRLALTDATLSPCPLNDEERGRRAAVPVRNDQQLPIEVGAVDRHGWSFNNFSSLELVWDVSDERLGVFPLGAANYDHIGLQPAADGAAKSNTNPSVQPTFIEADKRLSLLGESGYLVVTATHARYRVAYLLDSGAVVTADAPKTPITATLDLSLVPELQLAPLQLSVFNSKESIGELELAGGSGYVDVRVSRPGIVEESYSRENRRVRVRPLVEGDVQLSAYDTCLIAPPAVASVSIVDVDRLRLVGSDKVELGSSVRVAIEANDEHGRPIETRYFDAMRLESRLSSGALVSMQIDGQYSTPTRRVWLVHGNALGRTRLLYEATKRGGAVVRSNALDFQVFEPLQLDPRNVTLVKGALLQLSYRGGPQPRADVTYAMVETLSDGSLDGTAARVDDAGMLRAERLGGTHASAAIVGTCPVIGERLVYSSDSVPVHVVNLRAVRLWAPLSVIEVGQEMPLRAVGLLLSASASEHPFAFANNALYPISFSWSVDNKEVGDLYGPYRQYGGVSLGSVNNFAMLFYAVAPGHVTLQLRAIDSSGGNAPSAGEVLHGDGTGESRDQLTIRVIERFHLLRPGPTCRDLLMTPNTRMRLETSRDGEAEVSYHKVEGGELVQLDDADPGVLTSGATNGMAVIRVSANERFGVNRSSIAAVTIKDVSYMMLKPLGAWRSLLGGATATHQALPAVPLGASFSIQATQHDNLGQRFDSGNVELRYRPNRFDLLQVGIGSNDGTLTVKASKVGRTVLKVWHALRPHLVDYVNIVVEPAVAPSSTWFSAGEVICFRSALAPVGAVAVSSAKAGRWSVSVGAKSDGESGTVSSGGRGGKRLLSDDPGSSGRSGNERGAIAIDQSSGVAVALRPGRASVIFNATSTISTRADIGVSPLSAIRFQLPPTSSGGVVSNAADRLGVVFIPLRFVGRHERASWSGGLMLDASSSADGGSNKESSLLSGAGRRSCAALLADSPTPVLHPLAASPTGLPVDSTFPNAGGQELPVPHELRSDPDGGSVPSLYTCLISFASPNPNGVEANDVFQASAQFDARRLLFGCSVRRRHDAGMLAEESSHARSIAEGLSGWQTTLRVRVEASEYARTLMLDSERSSTGHVPEGSAPADDFDVDGDALELRFLPAFTVATSELHLVGTTDAQLIVVATEEVADCISIRLATHHHHATPSGPLIDVGRPESYGAGRWLFKIQVRLAAMLGHAGDAIEQTTAGAPSNRMPAQTSTATKTVVSDTLKVSCYLTGQEADVPLRVQFGGAELDAAARRQAQSGFFSSSVFNWSALSLGIVLCLLLVLMLIVLRLQAQTTAAGDRQYRWYQFHANEQHQQSRQGSPSGQGSGARLYGQVPPATHSYSRSIGSGSAGASNRLSFGAGGAFGSLGKPSGGMGAGRMSASGYYDSIDAGVPASSGSGSSGGGTAFAERNLRRSASGTFGSGSGFANGGGDGPSTRSRWRRSEAHNDGATYATPSAGQPTAGSSAAYRQPVLDSSDEEDRLWSRRN